MHNIATNNNTQNNLHHGCLTNADIDLNNLLITGSSILAQHGHEDINQGQISARSPGNKNNFLIKKALCPFYKVTAADIMKAPYDEKIQADRLAPPELPLHQAIYQARDDVNAIVHTHAYYSTLFSAFDWELEPISHDGACFIGHTARFDETSNTILSIELGRKVADALGNAKVIFLRNHGVVITGKFIKEAVVLSVFLEKACKIQIQANMCNSKYSVSNKHDVIEKQKFIFSKTSINYFWMCMEDAANERYGRTTESTKY